MLLSGDQTQPHVDRTWTALVGSRTANPRLPFPPVPPSSFGRQQDEKAFAHFILGTNLGPMLGHREEQIPGLTQDEADKDSEMRGEDHSAG